MRGQFPYLSVGQIIWAGCGRLTAENQMFGLPCFVGNKREVREVYAVMAKVFSCPGQRETAKLLMDRNCVEGFGCRPSVDHRC
jgi:hypothetical protein